MEKTFDPAEVESRIFEVWEAAQAFRAGRADRADAPPFSIVIPPPNVTGSLHMGHALNNTLQDIVCRFERMRGRDVLWQPGTDHAGIATQMVVERQLMERQEPNRRALGRAKFLDRVWAWKAESGGRIVHQLRRLGASCDWSRERFTMDDGLSRAVRKVFVDLYRQGLIYRDKRLVNWDPKLLTAVSDIEVVQVETKGHLWHFRYPVADESGRATSDVIVVATTRPETMLGDTGVAVHPEDPRYQHLVGKMVRLPLVGRLIPIVADPYSDPEKGTGAVKITPAHDFNDFEVGRRNNLALINIFDAEAHLDLQDNAAFMEGLDDAAEARETAVHLHGLSREEARKRIVEMMEVADLLDKVEPHAHVVPHGDRSNVVIEPWLTDQWYVDAQTLAGPALDAVRDGRMRFVPKQYEKTYFDWLEKIQPWCISRQLWWGHQIPAWYGPDGYVFVAEDEASATEAAKAHYGKKVALTRDEDVLDTWFSSALWPFSTLGWPEATLELKRYYPTSLLVTGFDIIFFWVARMMMMGLYFTGEVPFRDCYIHALVRDEKGAKMSKSKGNVLDPLGLIDTYGADALRFTLAALAAQGRDVKIAPARVEGYRNFATKLWNAARFADVNHCARVAGFDPHRLEVTLNRWIVSETARAHREVTTALETYRFNEAAMGAYRFVWNRLCDWYVELAKPLLQGEADEGARAETRATVAFVLDESLKLLHPFMPFITEELWAIKGESGPARDSLLTLAPWSDLSGLEDEKAEAEIGWVVDLVSEVRSVRSEMNVPPSAQIPLVLVGADAVVAGHAKKWSATIQPLARLSSILIASDAPPQSVQIPVRESMAALPLAGVIDFAAEQARLAKEIAKLGGESEKINAKLANADFMTRARPEVIDEQRERLADVEARRARLTTALARLSH
jgi:valyl-tRNA synthetase